MITKQNKIGELKREAVEELLNTTHPDYLPPMTDIDDARKLLFEYIDRAVLAERARCVEIARDTTRIKSDDVIVQEICKDYGEAIATAIEALDKDLYGQSVEDLDRPRVEKENRELNEALDKETPECCNKCFNICQTDVEWSKGVCDCHYPMTNKDI